MNSIKEQIDEITRRQTEVMNESSKKLRELQAEKLKLQLTCNHTNSITKGWEDGRCDCCPDCDYEW